MSLLVKYMEVDECLALLSSVTHLFGALFNVINKVQGFKFLPGEAVWKCESPSPHLNAITSTTTICWPAFHYALGCGCLEQHLISSVIQTKIVQEQFHGSR